MARGRRRREFYADRRRAQIFGPVRPRQPRGGHPVGPAQPIDAERRAPRRRRLDGDRGGRPLRRRARQGPASAGTRAAGAAGRDHSSTTTATTPRRPTFSSARRIILPRAATGRRSRPSAARSRRPWRGWIATATSTATASTSTGPARRRGSRTRAGRVPARRSFIPTALTFTTRSRSRRCRVSSMRPSNPWPARSRRSASANAPQNCWTKPRG